jgi:hypothetical protein
MNHWFRLIGAAALITAIAIVALAGCTAPFVSAQAKPASSSKDPRQEMLKFTQCMRQHGIDLPDPSSSGAITIGGTAGSAPPLGSDPNDPAFKAAESACQKYMPNGGPSSLTSQDAKANQQKGLKFSQCMRQHGLPNFPDPQSAAGGGTTFQKAPETAGGGGGGAMVINGQAFSSFDPNSPEFQKAQQACSSILGIKGGPGLSQGPPPSSSGH